MGGSFQWESGASTSLRLMRRRTNLSSLNSNEENQALPHKLLSAYMKRIIAIWAKFGGNASGTLVV